MSEVPVGTQCDDASKRFLPSERRLQIIPNRDWPQLVLVNPALPSRFSSSVHKGTNRIPSALC